MVLKAYVLFDFTLPLFFLASSSKASRKKKIPKAQAAQNMTPQVRASVSPVMATVYKAISITNKMSRALRAR